MHAKAERFVPACTIQRACATRASHTLCLQVILCDMRGAGQLRHRQLSHMGNYKECQHFGRISYQHAVGYCSAGSRCSCIAREKRCRKRLLPRRPHNKGVQLLKKSTVCATDSVIHRNDTHAEQAKAMQHSTAQQPGHSQQATNKATPATTCSNRQSQPWHIGMHACGAMPQRVQGVNSTTPREGNACAPSHRKACQTSREHHSDTLANSHPCRTHTLFPAKTAWPAVKHAIRKKLFP